MRKPKTNAEAFDLLLSHFEPERRGAVSRCADKLGTSSAVVSRWRTHGISAQFFDVIRKRVGMTPEQCRPEPMLRKAGAGRPVNSGA